MIYSLTGKVLEKTLDRVVLSCAGVGYEVNLPAGVAGALAPVGGEATVYTCLNVSENDISLFGFPDPESRKIFLLLTGVSGVGPKAAMAILSATTPDGLVAAVLNGNEKVITAAPGVGKKLAQRVLLELKDKVGKIDGIDTAAIPDLPPTAAVSGTDRNLSDAISGLLVLGYSQAEINGALKGVDTTGMTSEAIIKAVLRQMVK